MTKNKSTVLPLDVQNRQQHDNITPDFEFVQRVSSFPANFETNLGHDNTLYDSEKTKAPSDSAAASLHRFVQIHVEASDLPEGDDDVNLVKLSKSEHLEERCRSLSPLRQKLRSPSSLPQSPCSVGDDSRTKEGPASPFSLIENIPWFTNNTDRGHSSFNDKLLLPSLELTSKEKLDDDDNESVTSAAYFDPKDFDTSYWIKASMHVPTVGLALLAVTTAVAHPLLFLLGALTAFGTATAAIKGYDYIHSDNEDVDSLWQRVCSSSDLTDPCHGYPFTIGKEDTPILKIEANVEPLRSSASELTSEEKKDDDLRLPVIIIPEQNQDFCHQASTTSTQMTGTEGPPDVSPEWLDMHYPPLKQALVKNAVFVGLNCFEFHRVFFDDDAPYNFKIFQEKRGDINIQYTDWKHLPESGPISHAPNSCTNNFPQGLEYHSFQGRTLTFKARTNSFIGPPWATTKKTQRILIFSKRLAVLESRTDLSDIPYCDRFFVVERWVIRAEKDIDRYITSVSASCDVFFTSSCTFESQIRSKSTSTIRDIVTAWCVMATQALKLTEKAKLERLNRSHNDSHDVAVDDDDVRSSEKKCQSNEVILASTDPLPSNVLRRVCSNDAIEVTNLSQSRLPRALIVGEEGDNECEVARNMSPEGVRISTNMQQQNDPTFKLSVGWSGNRTKVWHNLRRTMTLNRSSQHR